ncbi:thialysine N-epsilon-acetyltransferase-like [Anser cygnoides]|uniref:thialysine N-epsilon-acetyltransferase-like n=1 Tax=Anser cygnoides TaxID=8845 RepID=UPI0034D3448A
MSYRVRARGRRHAPDVSRLVTEAAKLLGDPDAVKTTPERLLADGFGPRPKFGCLVAEAAGEEGRAVGVFLHHFSYCTWTGARALRGGALRGAPHRGRGIGRALVENAAKVALAHGCSQLRVLAPGGPGGPGGSSPTWGPPTSPPAAAAGPCGTCPPPPWQSWPGPPAVTDPPGPGPPP